jgi:hypothetical protein
MVPVRALPLVAEIENWNRLFIAVALAGLVAEGRACGATGPPQRYLY